jgi:hypothetical protein
MLPALGVGTSGIFKKDLIQNFCSDSIILITVQNKLVEVLNTTIQKNRSKARPTLMPNVVELA